MDRISAYDRLSDVSVFDESAGDHQVVRRNRSAVPLPVSIPPTPNNRRSLEGTDETEEADHANVVPFTVVMEDRSTDDPQMILPLRPQAIVGIPPIHPSPPQSHHHTTQHHSSAAFLHAQAHYAHHFLPPSSLAAHPYHSHHSASPPHEFSASSSPPTGSHASPVTSPTHSNIRHASRKATSNPASHHHLHAVDEMKAPSLSRSASFNSLFPPAVPPRPKSVGHSPPSLTRSLTTDASSPHHTRRPTRNHSHTDRKSMRQSSELSLLTNQLQRHSSNSPPSPASAAPHYRSTSSTHQLTNSHDFTNRSASYSHDSSPSGSRPPSPTSARLLQSLRDSFTSSHSLSLAHASSHGSASSSSSSHHPPHPFVHSQSLQSLHDHQDRNKERRSSWNLGQHGHHGHPPHYAHPIHSPTHSHSTSYHPPNSRSGSISTLHMSDDDLADNAITRSPSRSSSSHQATHPHSPAGSISNSITKSSILGGSDGPAYTWSVLSGPSTISHRESTMTSSIFEPQHVHGDIMALGWSAPLPPTTQNGGGQWEQEKKEQDNAMPPTLNHQQSVTNSASYCAVCLSDGADAFLLPCQHNFHARCILQWVESDHQQPQHRLSCPLCRQSIEQFVPLNHQIEDEDGDLLARFLRVWEKHYYQAPAADERQDSHGGDDDGEALIKKPQTQTLMSENVPSVIEEEDTQQALSIAPTPVSSPFVSSEDPSLGELTLEDLTPEQRAWQQMIQDVFFIPDSLPDDFIIPSADSATITNQPMFRQSVSGSAIMPDWGDHAANIAAADGGIVRNSSGVSAVAMLGMFHNPFALLSSLYTAFKSTLAADSAASPPTFNVRRSHSQPSLTPFLPPTVNRRWHGGESRSQSHGGMSTDEVSRTSLIEGTIIEEDSSIISGASSPAPPVRSQSASPAPNFIPLAAGATAGTVSTVIQQMTYSGSRAFAPTPLSAAMPAIAAYFTSYEMMKAELGLSPSLSDTENGDPRAALLTPANTGNYFAAAASAGAVSQVVKVALSPGVISLAGAFASTAQISARMGIQFSVFEQAKNAFALYRHKRTGEELTAGEVLVAASLGGVVAASIMYPLQHLLPTQHWGLTAPPPVVQPSAAPGAIPKPSFTACLGRFLPACVATAVTYEYAFRFFRNNTRSSATSHQYNHHHSSVSGSSLFFPTAAHAAAATSSSSSYSATLAPELPTTGQGLVQSIADRTSSILASVSVDASNDEITRHIPFAEPSSSRPRLPAPSYHPHSSVSVHPLGHHVPVVHHLPTEILPRRPPPSHPPTGSLHRPPTATHSFGATLTLPTAMNAAPAVISRSRSHPTLASLRDASAPPSILDPW